MVIARERLARQGLTGPAKGSAAAVVRALGAVQAQEFVPAQWALALRLRPGATLRDTLCAHDRGRILRTHVLRPTWHFVSPRDIRWMLELSAPQVHRAMAPYDRRLGLDPPLLTRAAGVVERALGEEGFLTRAELGERLGRAGIAASSWRLGHMMLWIELESVVTSGPRRGAQHTYALLADRAPGAPRLPRDEALGELARRYFTSHGPATVQDFMWWSGLKAPDARRAMDIARPRRTEVDGRAYWMVGRAPRAVRRARAFLLPIYDEYTVAYRHRGAVPAGPAMARSPRGGYVRFQHAVVIDGQVAGTWRTAPRPGGGAVDVVPLRRLTREEARAVALAVRRYECFIGQPGGGMRQSALSARLAMR